jgi:hypothetical protein
MDRKELLSKIYWIAANGSEEEKRAMVSSFHEYRNKYELDIDNIQLMNYEDLVGMLKLFENKVIGSYNTPDKVETLQQMGCLANKLEKIGMFDEANIVDKMMGSI